MSQNSGVVFHCIIIYFNIFGSDLYSKIHWIMTDPYICWLNEQNIFRFVPIVLQDMMSHFPQIRKVLVPTSPVPYPWMKLIFTFYFIFYSDYNRNSTSLSSYTSSTVAGDGVYTALWMLFLALLFKGLITIFTFGIKVGFSFRFFSFN